MTEFAEYAPSSDTESTRNNDSTDSQGIIEVGMPFQPYQNEPLANSSSEESTDDDGDEDGLLMSVLQARYEKTEHVDKWCSCGLCRIDLLIGAREFRCCKEVGPVIHKLSFDGSIEKIKCITQHEDFGPLTHRAVLTLVGHLLKDRNGRGYRRKSGQSENDLLRAVSYRWIIRWLCGYLGWENTRPLPACVYHNIRVRYGGFGGKGYATSEARK